VSLAASLFMIKPLEQSKSSPSCRSRAAHRKVNVDSDLKMTRVALAFWQRDIETATGPTDESTP
jgi:hypothetical protein